MAIFEKKVLKKVLLDDTQTITCQIENTQTINGHTEYILKVQRGPIPSNYWRVYRRYNDFVALHNHLQQAGYPLPLPPKKLIGNMSREFIAERQQALQNYLNIVLMNPILASSLSTKRFVDPNNYSVPIHEVALQHVSLALRGEVGWEVVGPLTDVGWRLRKHYFQVRKRSNAKEELIASWVEYGPDKQLEEKCIQSVFKSLMQLEHVFIYPIELGINTEIGGLTIRKLCKNGSLRDLLCGAKPKQSFMKKYGNSKCHKPLTESQIALYGRQVLEALRFLHDKGIPYEPMKSIKLNRFARLPACEVQRPTVLVFQAPNFVLGHLHTGNIFIENEELIKLVDIENGVLGVPSFYRPFIVQHKKISSMEAIDVYSFGHTIFEMVFGTPLHESVCDDLPGECPPSIRSVLELILSSEACRNGLPSIDQLRQHPCFASVNPSKLHLNDRISVKISTNVKEKLNFTALKIEERLKEEQRTVRSQKRLVRVQEMMSTEEEKKKRRHKTKQDQKDLEGKEKSLREQLSLNGISPDHCDSVNSASTATSVGTVTPPSVAGDIPSPPKPPKFDRIANGSGLPPVDESRSALLGSICNFNKTSLKRTKGKNRST